MKENVSGCFFLNTVYNATPRLHSQLDLLIILVLGDADADASFNNSPRPLLRFVHVLIRKRLALFLINIFHLNVTKNRVGLNS